MAVTTGLVAEHVDRMVLHLRRSERGALLIASTPDDDLARALASVVEGRIRGEVEVVRFAFSSDGLDGFSLARRLRELPSADGRRVLFAFGLDALEAETRERAIAALNWGRGRLAWADCSVVLWVRPATVGELMLEAPDFFAWRSGAFDFDLPAGSADRLETLAALAREPAPTLATLRRRYLAWLEARHTWLDFSGIPQVHNLGRVPLDAVFVELSVMQRSPASDGHAGRGRPPGRARVVDGRDATTAEHLGREPEPTTAARPIALAEALVGPRLVILGEPGSGKTTLLKHVALRLAEGRGSDLGLTADALPILLSIASYAAALRADPVLTIERYLGRYVAERGLAELEPLFEHALRGGHAVVLLDGLDEVLDQRERAAVVARVADFVSRFGRSPEAGNRFVVTSRIAGYDEAPLADFAHFTVLPFGDAAIRRFAELWHRAWEPGADASVDAARRAAERARRLAEAIRASERVSLLATNPLLLTIIALIHHQNVRLPEQRVELYRLAVEALAETWNRARDLGGEVVEARLGGQRLDARFVARVLGPVALWLHEHRPGGLVEEAALVERISQELSGDVAQAGAFLDLVRRTSGLLQERGLGLYGFMHLTFEEYLAARAIVDLHDPPEPILLAHWQEPAWKEVLLLAAGASPPARAARLVEALLDVRARGSARGHSVVLAGEILADVGASGATDAAWARTVEALTSLVLTGRVEPGVIALRVGAVLERIRWLPRAWREAGRVEPAVRAAAADVLGTLRTPRFVEDEWVQVPAGEFTMGTSEEEAEALIRRFGPVWKESASGETPRHRVFVGAFEVGKYEVTNREFKRFIDAGGYVSRELWSEAGWKWLEQPPSEEGKLSPRRQRA